MFETGRAIIYACEEAGLTIPPRTLVINDRDRTLKGSIKDADFWDVEIDIDPPSANYDAVILFSSKQKEENRLLMARALTLAAPERWVMAAAANDAGGKTLNKTLVGFGVPVEETAKHKCRVVWTRAPQRAARIMIDDAVTRGGITKRIDGMYTQPGLFSWDRIDKGSDALIHHLPLSLKGQGADFGCGIGVIAIRVMQRYADVKKLICIDIDARALDCAARNLSEWPDKIFLRRADLSQEVDLGTLDFIVMNPPFHAGKKQSITLGQSFIKNAAKNLRTGGMLVFVANSHLPYEKTVSDLFAFNRVLSEENGFKIIEAVK
jgi:16S rRNA (guanine1207-N2)-methyltransferase